MHIYIVLIPFIPLIKSRSTPYSNYTYAGFMLKDIEFNVDEPFYRYLFGEMCQNGNRPVILKLDNWAWKTVRGDPLIQYSNEEKGDVTHTQYEEWFEQGKYENTTIRMTNPYLYLVPFPVDAILFNIKNTNTNTFLTTV